MSDTFVYVVTSDSGRVKVGASSDPYSRVRSLQSGSFEKLEVFETVRCLSRAHAFEAERLTHKELSDNRITGEWFTTDPRIALDTAISCVEATAQAHDGIQSSAPDSMPYRHLSKSPIRAASVKKVNVDIDIDIYRLHRTCREFILNDDVPRLCRDAFCLKSKIAEAIGYSPSHFTNKLNNVEGHRFTLDDLERYVRVTGSVEPVKYLVAKYLFWQSPDEIDRQIAELQKRKAELEAGDA